MNRTLEERMKFDHGLRIGRSLVDLTHAGRTRRALVEITARGVVTVLAKPEEGDMYSMWQRIRGDVATTKDRRCGVIVWGARDPELMRMFDGEPAATIPLR